MLYCPRRNLVTLLDKNKVVTAFFKKWRYCDYWTGGIISIIIRTIVLFTIIITVTGGKKSQLQGFLLKVSHNSIFSHSCDRSTGGTIKAFK